MKTALVFEKVFPLPAVQFGELPIEGFSPLSYEYAVLIPTSPKLRPAGESVVLF